jgi:hypothetical protein
VSTPAVRGIAKPGCERFHCGDTGTGAIILAIVLADRAPPPCQALRDLFLCLMLGNTLIGLQQALTRTW